MVDYFRALRQTTNHGVAHVYFDYKEQEAQTPIQILCSLLKQLLGQLPVNYPASTTKLYDRLRPQNKRPTIDELYTALIAASKSFPRVFLVFDALDECGFDARTKLLPLFKQMGKDGINIFLTSRPHPEDIQDSLTINDVVKIELSAQTEDVVAYIQERIDKNQRARRLVQQANCKERIISELVDCAEGM